MLKSKLSLLACAVLASMAFSGTRANAATYNAGDLIMGFRVTGGIGASSNVLVNLGQSTTFRNLNGTNSLNITNIFTDLSNTFGTGAGNGTEWYNRTDLSFGVIGVYTNISDASGGTVNNGDPGQTIYMSRSRTSAGTVGTAQSSTPSGFSNANMSTISGNVLVLNQTTYAGATASVNNSAVAIINAGGSQSYTFFTNPTSDFGAINPGIEQTFTASAWSTGSLGPVSNIEGAVDLYRVLQTTNNANPTGTAKTGSYETTFVINQSGQISAVSAVPEPSTYALLGIGAIAVVFAVRRRQAKA